MEMNENIGRIRDKIREARRVAVLTGAGISAESGVPTFRGKDGLWKHHRAVDLATPQAFDKDPSLVWGFYSWRRKLINGVRPNPAHIALAELEQSDIELTLITQNVDGLHIQAGSRNVVEIHGSIWSLRCTRCGDITHNREIQLPELPQCDHCGGLLRPNVVWFGESLDAEVLGKAISATENCEVMLVIGTSAVVQPAASLAMHAGKGKAFTAEVNLERTIQSNQMDAVLTGPAGELLPELFKGIK